MEKFSLRKLFVRSKTPRDRRHKDRLQPRLDATILVVDDSRTVQFTLRNMLQQAGYHILEARNGENAIELAREHKPDLIFMDVVMPGMTGFQATRALRKYDETRDIPIVVMSANEQATEKFWVIKIGANDFMTKPFQRRTVFEKLDHHLHAAEVA